MIYLKHDEEIELIRKSSVLVCETIAEVSSLIKVGSSGSILDKRAEEFIRDYGGIPAFKGHHGFPASLCISINEAVVHGIPNELVFQEGDLISVDCGVVMNGYYGDSAYTFGLGNISEKVKELMKVTDCLLYTSIPFLAINVYVQTLASAAVSVSLMIAAIIVVAIKLALFFLYGSRMMKEFFGASTGVSKRTSKAQ